MTKEDLKSIELPDTPGVYFFLTAQKKILYIGKATSLKSRVRSYFASDIKEKRSPLIEQMVSESASVEYTQTDSVLEALILETNLIRTHKPLHNTKSKDDKSYNHIVITNEEWPRLLVVRSRDIHERFEKGEIKYEFGPYTSGSLLRDALKIIRKLFRFYDTKHAVGTERTKLERGRIDFNRQIGLYPTEANRVEYLRTIRHLKLFFEGKKKQIIAELERDMMRHAKREEFEEANVLKKKIFALKHIEDISLMKHDFQRESLTLDRIEAYDIAHHAGKEMVGVMTVVANSETRKEEYRKFKIKSLTDANDPAALREVLVRRLAHPEWPTPKVIVVDGNEIQKNAAEEVLKAHGLLIPVVAVVKDDRHKASRLIIHPSLEKYRFDALLANSESHRFAIAYHRERARKRLLK